jgi:heparan-alpha-glucosaminide N-acetyltransferase
MTKNTRIASIDVFRALTMLLMIWVNDFWTLENVPKWLQHAHSGEDFLGFSDLIFPWFIFIVGLSIPFAIENRLSKGDSKLRISYHIVIRTIALLAMGFFHVNYDSIDADQTGISRALFILISTAAFFLIWNRYPKTETKRKYLYGGLQSLGIIILLVLFTIFKGKDGGEGMKVGWWGILGLIGWTYLMAALIYLLLRKTKYLIIVFFFGFILLNILTDRGISYDFIHWKPLHWFVGNGSLHTLALGGILTSILLTKFSELSKRQNFYSLLLLSSIVLMTVGFILHKYIIISKIGGTSTWILFSLASAIFLFSFLHWLIDHLDKANWFSLIKTAGTATLTCYLIPYFYYNFRTLLHIDFNGFITNGVPGLIKSMAFAFIIVGITWLLGKLKIQLKI